MLSSPQLWTEVYTTPCQPEVELAQACIERSKDPPLDIRLNIYTKGADEEEESMCDEVFFVVQPPTYFVGVPFKFILKPSISGPRPRDATSKAYRAPSEKCRISRPPYLKASLCLVTSIASSNTLCYFSRHGICRCYAMISSLPGQPYTPLLLSTSR